MSIHLSHCLSVSLSGRPSVWKMTPLHCFHFKELYNQAVLSLCNAWGRTVGPMIWARIRKPLAIIQCLSIGKSFLSTWSIFKPTKSQSLQLLWGLISEKNTLICYRMNLKWLTLFHCSDPNQTGGLLWYLIQNHMNSCSLHLISICRITYNTW